MIAHQPDRTQSLNTEPTKCSECPFFTQSDRSPSCGSCSLHDEAVLGQDKPGDLCIVSFWSLAASVKPVYTCQPRITVGNGKATLTGKSGKVLACVSI